VRSSPEHAIRHRPNLKEHTLKKDLHPTYVATTVTCTCGSTFETRSTVQGGKIGSDVCSQCHPFYTGKQKILDTGGRIARFQARYGKKADAPADSAPADSAPADSAKAETAAADK
jgi:large subunit ribosomal protein L31